MLQSTQTVCIKQILACIAVQFLFVNYSWAQSNTAIATAVEVSGEAWIVNEGANDRVLLSEGQSIRANELVVTGVNGKVALLLADETLLRLHFNSEFKLRAVAPVAGWLAKTKAALQSSYQLLKGEMWFRNKRRVADIEIETTHLSVTVRGTEFVVIANEDVTLVNMLEGRVSASNSYGSIDAQSGEQIIGQFGQAPFKRVLLNPDDAVQWTIRLPSLFSIDSLFSHYFENNDAIQKGQKESNTGIFSHALSLSQKGDYQQVIEILNKNRNNNKSGSSKDDTKRDGELLEAWAYLESGRIDKSVKLLEQFTKRYKSDLRGWQVLALSALLNNEKNRALEASIMATQLAPDNAESWLLKSYALQSQFELTQAENAAEQAVKQHAGLVSAWLQRATLAIAKGEYRSAERLVKNAQSASLHPTADIDATRGFIALAMGQRNQAQQYFSKALKLDGSFAPAYLGQALAAMEINDTEIALKSIATAVTIEPLNASYLNYYAKIAYETGRFERSIEMLQRAAELDSNDPTPFYLQAIIARDKNQDGKAVSLLKQASKLNDNRAVYRSRYLLDADLAVKNVDLSLSFQRFDFSAWAERRAIQALQLDRQNFSAHLMYANTLNNVPGRDSSFAAETLLARLLQPANANFFNIASDRSFLFDQPRLAAILGYTVGSFDNIDREVTLFGGSTVNNFAFQLNVLDAQSDGWRPTQNESLESFAAIGKWEPTINHSFYISALKQSLSDADELLRRFEFSSPSEPRDSRDNDIERIELGYNYRLNAGSRWLTYFDYQRSSSDITDASVDIDQLGFNTTVRDTINTIDFSSETAFVQSQYMTKLKRHDLVAGILFRYSELQRIDDVMGDIEVFDSIGNLVTTVENTAAPLLNINNNVRTEFISGYITDRWRFNDSWVAEAALYWDFFQNAEPLTDEEFQDTRLNGRIGLAGNIGSSQTVRAAAYRYTQPVSTLSRIDPVEVVGLGVYRHNVPGSFTDEASLSWELEMDRAYLQVLGFYSEVDVEGRQRFSTISNELFFESTMQQVRNRGVETRYNQFFTKNIGLSLSWSHFKIDDDFSPLNSREEDLVSLDLNFVYGNGISFDIEYIYRNLHGLSRVQDDEPSLTNIGFEYEFPKNLGLLKLEINNIEDNNFDWVTDSFVLDGRIPRRQYLATIEIYAD